ncbi:MAG UNVERIFIED_CONTAM: efflux RND transporter permease subunit [Planctomycetaceae bacterium]
MRSSSARTSIPTCALGKTPLQAAIDGTIEVVPSVFSSVATTIFAFVPMFFVTGVMGKFFAVIPLAVITILTISLTEACFALPCHLANDSGRPSPFTIGLNRGTNFVLDTFIRIIYQPVIRFSTRNPAITVSLAIAFLLLSAALVTSGTVPSIFFPKLDAPEVLATVIFPDGTPSRITDAATARIEQAILDINRKHSTPGCPLIVVTHRMVGIVRENAPGGGQVTEGSHAGSVYAELVDAGLREATSEQIIQEWRAAVGQVPGVEKLTFGSQARGPGGKPIEFKLLAPAADMQQLEQAIEATKVKLAGYTGVFDVSDDSTPGKWELQLTEKQRAQPLGIPLETIARTVRSAYYGEEVMRLQRGRHEVKLMVRYPEADRRAIGRFEDIRVDGGDGVQRPITELADVAVTRGYSEINRIDQKRSITISSDLDETRGNAKTIVADLRASFIPELLKKYPSVRVRWEGQQEQDEESVQSLGIGLFIALIAMYVLLTMEFTSYGQPLVVMAIIPFGIVGAVLGHWVMDLPLTLFSTLGLVALTGIVVNDSIVLVDFLNSAVRSGTPVEEAVLQAGARRFRPVMLTSLTTIAGLAPILAETSFQAQLVIPMAASLCFGLMTSTVLVLVLVPTFYLIYARMVGIRGATSAPQSETAEIAGASPAV